MILSAVLLTIIVATITTLIIGVQRSKSRATTQLTQDRIDYWKAKLAEAEAQHEEFQNYAKSHLENQPVIETKIVVEKPKRGRKPATSTMTTKTKAAKKK
jgi:hypothetical protein